MRKSYSTQLRLDTPPINQVQLNFDCRESVVPVLRSLQHVYSKPDATEKNMQLIGREATEPGNDTCDKSRLVKLAKCVVLTWREPLASAIVPVLLREERRRAVSGRSSTK